ncbi:DUF2972 domain-containing protein [Helicobacter sp. MIT 03-1614]|uniref:DUF2972 domain-containing protein n=1 Tax=Helicobacter sp. MIT 03-1614 TaxID=1548147 RepID=UPI0010FF4442|nr:DUF2972 domain-containing protein [Helicobacter sp. MIT 03-1614]TLD90032.1 DUF2972 domain-containing protein [Helicobacter sp. MIT 03-1614]
MFYIIFVSHMPHKFHIYKILKRFHILTTHTPTLVFISQHYEEIISWIESKEFKEQYVDKNHPYPPLLNPKRLNAKRDKEKNNNNKETEWNKNEGELKECGANLQSKEAESKDIQPYPNLSYESISPELAWDLNVPLPQSDMVKFESHGVGSIFSNFIQKLGISIIMLPDNLFCVIKVYKILYNALNNGARVLLIRDYLPAMNQNAKKLHFLIQKPRIMILNQVRDPISMLKHYVGVKRRPEKALTSFNLGHNPKEIVSSLVRYSGGYLYPSVKEIPFWVSFTYMCFHDGMLFKEMINLTAEKVKFMDMPEIVGERTIPTLCKFAKIFNVPPPKEEDREFFLAKNTDFGGLLPLVMYVYDKSCDKKITIYIIKKFYINELVDISIEMLGALKHDTICIGIQRENLEYLRANGELYTQTKSYLQELIQELISQNEREKLKKFSEKDVLEFMEKNPKIRQKFKSILDEHLSLIKQEHPDIIESWKYYQEFERM